MQKFYNAVELFFIGLLNLLYNAGILTYEFIRYGNRKWWWSLRWQFLVNYATSPAFRIVRGESPDQEYPQDNFIYGETPAHTLEKILTLCDARRDQLFIDLGCGRGLTVYYANFLFGMKAHGYELLPTFIQKSRQIKEALDARGVKFYQKDILKADIKKARIIFIAGTTFDDSFIVQLTEKLREAGPGAVIVTLSYRLPEKFFSLFREQKMLFTWGTTHVYFHRRRDKAKSPRKSEGNCRDDISPSKG